jgi:hypothetical protein
LSSSCVLYVQCSLVFLDYPFLISLRIYLTFI